MGAGKETRWIVPPQDGRAVKTAPRGGKAATKPACAGSDDPYATSSQSAKADFVAAGP
jgi:hypothetical protein